MCPSLEFASNLVLGRLVLAHFLYTGNCIWNCSGSACNCAAFPGAQPCRNGSDIEGDSEDTDFDQSSFDEDEEEYESGDVDYEDEELDEAAAFAQV